MGVALNFYAYSHIIPGKRREKGSKTRPSWVGAHVWPKMVRFTPFRNEKMLIFGSPGPSRPRPTPARPCQCAFRRAENAAGEVKSSPRLGKPNPNAASQRKIGAGLREVRPAAPAQYFRGQAKTQSQNLCFAEQAQTRRREADESKAKLREGRFPAARAICQGPHQDLKPKPKGRGEALRRSPPCGLRKIPRARPTPKAKTIMVGI